MPAPSIPRDFSTRSHGPPVDTNVLAARWRVHSDWNARDELFERFLPLARRLARRYDRPHEPFEDLVQVASVGLLGAIDRFDPERGIAFAAFAIPTILGELKRYFRATGWSAHVPRAAQETALRIDRAIDEITAATGRGPGVYQLAEYLELSAEEILAGLDGDDRFAGRGDRPVAITGAPGAAVARRAQPQTGRDRPGAVSRSVVRARRGAVTVRSNVSASTQGP